MGATTVRKEGVIEAPLQVVYDVIADVERYPEFLPDLKSVTREGDQITMSVKLGPTTVTWKQVATFDPCRTISMRLLSGPFKAMSVDWRFEETGGGTRVSNNTEFELKLPMPSIDGIVGKALQANTERTIEVFRRRIAQQSVA